MSVGRHPYLDPTDELFLEEFKSLISLPRLFLRIERGQQ